MNKEVYSHVLATYGHRLGCWISLIAEVLRTLIVRVCLVIIVAQLTANLAAHDIAAAKHNVLLYFILGIIGLCINTVGELFAAQAEQAQYGKLSAAYHKKLTGKDMSFYRDNQSGYLVSAFRQYLDGMVLLVRFIRSDVIRMFISLLIPALVLTIANWRIGIIAYGVIAVQAFYIFWSSSKANYYRELSHEIYRKVTGEVSDEITNITAFKSSGVEQQAGTIVANLAREESRAFAIRRRMSVAFEFPRELLTTIGISLTFWVIVNTAANSYQSVSLIVLTLTYMFQINRNVSDLPNLIQQHDDLITKIYPSIKYLTADYEHIRDPERPTPLIISNGKINFKNVEFSYQTDTPGTKQVTIFKDFNLAIHGGEHIGLVGLSGAGKSTLMSLLLRFDEVTSGSITIDGTDIRQVSQTDLHTNIAYVPQEPLLFHRTIRDNIAYFKSDSSQLAIEQAAKTAHAHEFISKLPAGYDSLVGDRGIKLSGGQKQRVVIARAILKQAPIMIFDEATSALDSESEQIIQRALPDIIGKQTAIVIAHRLSTIQGMDRIAVMDKGTVVQLGRHSELLADKNGIYAKLWAHQSGVYNYSTPKNK